MLKRISSQDYPINFYLRSFAGSALAVISIFIATCLAGPGALALTPEAAANADAAKIRSQCEIKRIAKACYETGLTEMHYNDAKHRKSARHFLKLACSIEKHAICNRNESKVATKAYLATPGRMPATTIAKAPITAPKITASKTTSFSSNAPAPFEPSRAPLEPLHPSMPVQPMPQMEMPPPPQPMAESGGPVGMPPMPMGCVPGDAACGTQPQ